MKYISFLVAFLLCFLIGTTALAQEIKGMRLASSTADAVRFVADLSAEAQVLVSRLSNPPRLVLDFKNTTFSPLAKAQKFSPVNLSGVCARAHRLPAPRGLCWICQTRL